jgi:hypothetical protein
MTIATTAVSASRPAIGASAVHSIPQVVAASEGFVFMRALPAEAGLQSAGSNHRERQRCGKDE